VIKKVVFILSLLTLINLPEQAMAQKAKLPENYKKWLDEEVVYIIGSTERDVFLQLKTDRERELFIEAFWRHRDPTPGTPENEFKTEHFRRINYANHFFGRQTTRPGWKTDRGRVYIILGEPNDIQRFDAQTMTYSAEVWFYQGKENLGLPPGFNLVFFQEGGSGEFVLYSPVRHGPMALLNSWVGDPLDYQKAYEQLQEVSPNLATYSLSLIPGEQSSAIGRPSLASDLLIQRVEMSPRIQLEEKYAQKFLQYKDIVEVDYSTNYIESDSLVKVFKEPSGYSFVHFALEPARLSVNAYENKYFTVLKISGKVTDTEGKTIYQFDRDINFNLDEEQIKTANLKPLNIHDMFPLIPGEYNFSLILKNEASKEFSTLERKLLISGEETPLQMTSLILGFKASRVERQDNRLKPFRLGAYQVYFQPNRTFTTKDNLVVGFQIYGLNPGLSERAELRFVFFKNEQEFRSFSKKTGEYSELPNFVTEYPLADFSPAHYKIRVSLLVDSREVVSAAEEFDISHLAALRRPWVYSKILAEPENPVYDYIIGTQLFNRGKTSEAKAKLEEAFRKNPQSIDFALSLAQAYLVLAEYNKVAPILAPFLNLPKPPKYELYMILGKAYQSAGEPEKAIQVFDQGISHYGINVNILNALGDCYFQLGKAEEALVTWKKSLELNPDQPQIKKYVETLKEKK